jgi:hypothetical protein
MDRYSLLTLVSDFNQAPDRYSEQEAEIIRSLAKQLDMSVKQKSPEINLLDVLGLVLGGAGLGAAGKAAFKGGRGLMRAKKSLFDMVSDPIGTRGISNVGGFVL